MNLSYVLKESLSGFQRAKLATAISIFTIAISLVLLSIFLILTQSAVRVLEEIRSRVEVEFFLSETLSPSDAKALTGHIRQHHAVAQATYISKDDAAKIFEKEFGEKIEQILGTNPLPQSIKVNLRPEYARLDSLEKFVAAVSKESGVLDVRYNRELLSRVDSNARILFFITAALGILIAFASIALVSNTIRLAIYSKREIIRTMQLVGATFNFIRLPFLLEGVLQGLVGGVLAAGLVTAMMTLLARTAPDIYAALQPPNALFLFVLTLVGAGLGLIGSFLSVRKFIE
ncbi:MAG: ABC transporter permease [Chloroherpetonaceae bacterium]|nr:ABC transporter permease [Chloroherpetonaceae bacterium]MCS7212098.1 ABC transporter permease [Chloroherpetonaceae bacterium]MDW8020048.1 ABC transporter permease [Chloroherpetonaceae bacterium]